MLRERKAGKPSGICTISRRLDPDWEMGMKEDEYRVRRYPEMNGLYNQVAVRR